MSMPQRLIAACCSLLAVAALGAPAVRPRFHVQVRDAFTGAAIRNVQLNWRDTGGRAIVRAALERDGDAPARMEPPDAATTLVVASGDYSPASIDLGRISTDSIQQIELEPIQHPAELAPDYQQKIHAPGQTLISGWVTDAATGALLAGVKVTAADGSVVAYSDDRGFFYVNVPVRREYDADGLLFTHDGYRGERRRNIGLTYDAAWVYRVALDRGTGIAQRDYKAPDLGEDEQPDGHVAAMSVSAQAVSCSVPEPPTGLPASKTRIPRNIRIQNGTGSLQVPFGLYCTRVLSSEWEMRASNADGAIEGYKAGAVAVRSYAIGFVNEPHVASGAYDICTTTTCQVYDPTRWHASADQAYQQTKGAIVVNDSDRITKRYFADGAWVRMAEFSAEDNDSGCGDGMSGGAYAPCVCDPVCTGKAGNGHGRGMCQNGSVRWGSGYYNIISQDALTGLPKHTWQWIVGHYYPEYHLALGAELQRGDDVRVFGSGSTGVRVRPCAGVSAGCDSNVFKFDGTTGRIVDGPIESTGDNYTWWQISWSDGTTGWSVENYLEHASAAAAAAPNVPAAPAQTTSTGASVAVGASTNDRAPRFNASVSGQGSVALEIELRRLDEYNGAFTGTATHTSPLVASGATALIGSVAGLIDGSYHWRARTLDAAGARSAWVSFGGNSDSAADFVVVSAATASQPSVRGKVDFNGDGWNDIVWRHTNGANSVWHLEGGMFRSGSALPAVSDPQWKLISARDFNADGKPDLLWRHAVTGANAIWLMNGAQLIGSADLPVLATNWALEAAADFDGNGSIDLVWHNHADGQVVIWLLSGTTVSAGVAVRTASDLNWHIAGADDVDADGDPDLYWRHAVNGLAVVWRMNGTSFGSSADLPSVADTAWKLVSVADFTGDGRPDLLWRHSLNGANALWLMNGTAFVSGTSIDAVADVNWSIAGPR